MPDFKFWNERWINGQIGFHQNTPHKSLVEYIDLLKPHKNIFVPLCGKSLDMIYLREHGHNIIGVEFSEIAVHDFISEHNLKLKKTKLDHFNLYEGEGFKIYQGDIFNLTDVELKNVSACYDRASMVAFSFAERVRYSQFLIKNATDLDVILSPLLDYGDLEETMPPFSVTKNELNSLYSKDFILEELIRSPIPLRDALKERGAPYECEVTWFFTKKH